MSKSNYNRILALLLCVLLFTSAAPGALAAEPEMGVKDDINDQRAAEPELNVVDADELQELVEQAIRELHVQPGNLSIGYCYTATGETWFYREDDWYYSASLYKVPLMMILAQREHEGELTRESNIMGLTLGSAEHYILTLSNNDYAHWMMNYIGSDRECRELYRQFSDLPEEYYVDSFYNYSYFTAHFMLHTMRTLYYEQERFPNIINCLLEAQPGSWFKRTGDGEFEIAQKYGSLVEVNGTNNNHTAGIVYTPNPFILVVMTRDTSNVENVIADIKQRFQDYTLALDERLEPARQELADRLAEEERAAEEERLAQENAQAEAEVSDTVPATQAPAAATPTPEKEKRIGGAPLWAGGLVLIVLLAVIVYLGRGKANRRKRRRVPVRTAWDEERPVREERPKKSSDRYTPRH